MTTLFIGTTFPATSDWHRDECELINNIRQQIDHAFSTGSNLFINTTWFGPQFDNSQWANYKTAIAQQHFDRVFLLAAADPVFLNAEQIDNIQKETQAELYLLGHFDSKYYFNFHSQVLPRYFVDYCESQLAMTSADYIYINYNRKPRDHRSALVNKLIDQNLLEHGIVTLGQANNMYSRDVEPQRHLTLNETTDDAVGNWGMNMDLGIPHDIHSLGSLDRWQRHFLNIVGETEFLPWDNMFISEKTWKPVLGLRPFLINGQTKIYQYLRSQGFRTFNHYWPHIELEDIAEYCVHDSIIAVIKHLRSMSREDLQNLYHAMLPDLIHNRNRFAEYSAEQQHKINHLFQ